MFIFFSVSFFFFFDFLFHFYILWILFHLRRSYSIINSCRCLVIILIKFCTFRYDINKISAHLCVSVHDSIWSLNYKIHFPHFVLFLFSVLNFIFTINYNSTYILFQIFIIYLFTLILLYIIIVALTSVPFSCFMYFFFCFFLFDFEFYRQNLVQTDFLFKW